MLVSLLSFWLALATLALPLERAHADSNDLSAYGVTASGWAIQPYVENDTFQNVPAADQSAPYVFVSLDNTPGARAKASYLFPGTAISAVPNTQGVNVNVPSGVEARYPGAGSANGTVGAFNDNMATRANAGSQAAQASEGYALAQAAITDYQFAPTLPAAPPPSVPGAPSLPTPPPLPTASSGGATPTATPGSSGSSSTPTPTPTSCPLIICIPGQSNSSHGGVNAAPQTAPGDITLATLPDPIEQQLAAELKAAQISQPALLALAGGHTAAIDPTLPYASADSASQAETRATNDGVTAAVDTHAQKIELFQGLITFSSIESQLQASAPASTTDKGAGTIRTTIADARIGGIPVTIDQNGVTVNDQNVSAAQVQALTDQLNTALTQAGVHISLMKSVISADVGFWQGAGAGVEVTADIVPANYSSPTPPGGVPPAPTLPATGIPGVPTNPAGAVPGTHVDFSIGDVNASLSASPPDTGSGSGSSGGGYGYGYSGGGGVCLPGSSGSSASGPATSAPSVLKGAFSLPGGLSGGSALALVFVIQGLSTAVAAAAGGITNPEQAVEALATEEETQ